MAPAQLAAQQPKPAAVDSAQPRRRARRSPPSRRRSRPSAARQYCVNIANAAADARFAWQKKTLADTEQELEKRIALLEAKTAEFQKWVTRRDEFVKKARDNLVLIYSRMRPDAAAMQLTAMDEETASAVLLKLEPRTASLILNEMEPAQAARLTAIIGGAARTTPAGDAAAGPGGKEVMSKVALVIGCLLLLGGCADQVTDFAREPHLTPGRRRAAARPGGDAERAAAGALLSAAATRSGRTPAPISSATRAPCASATSMTVKISIKDKASFDNTSERSRDSKRNLNFDTNYDLNLPFWKGKGDGKLDSTINSGTSTKGQGAITRSESIELLVAAVVSDVLPNGNLVISGTQEVRVNFELRVLSVAGVVRPRDIATDNTISYDKIAEARISYGGRGRITEVQQPGWGQQLYDLISPF